VGQRARVGARSAGVGVEGEADKQVPLVVAKKRKGKEGTAGEGWLGRICPGWPS
jgi:hypothetical protein